MQWFASFFPLYKILLALDSLIIICLDMNLFKFILLGVCLASWMYWFMYFFKFEMLLALFIQVSFSLPSLFPLLLRLSLLIFSTILDNVTGISGVVYLLLLLFIMFIYYYFIYYIFISVPHTGYSQLAYLWICWVFCQLKYTVVSP